MTDFEQWLADHIGQEISYGMTSAFGSEMTLEAVGDGVMFGRGIRDTERKRAVVLANVTTVSLLSEQR